MNGRSTSLGRIPGFQHEDGGALAHHEAIAIHVERTRCGRGILGAAAERTHATERSEGEGVTAASAPPTITTSALPSRMRRIPSPMAWAPAAHAVVMQRFGPV